MKRYACPVDNSAILYLALMRKRHTNIFRFNMHLTEPVDPAALNLAMERVWKRFPTIVCGFKPGFFGFTQVQAPEPPKALPDPGLLHMMSREEITRCAYRLYYHDCDLIFESFHAVTDGYGSLTSFTTLVAEYLRIRHGVEIPVELTLRDLDEDPQPNELEDSYLKNCNAQPLHIPSRYSYQLPGHYDEPIVRPTIRRFPLNAILAAAKAQGVSLTTFLSGIMAQSVMEVQKRHRKKLLPVRIMVPADLRRLFSSTTLRNFILYALPTMEPGEEHLPLKELLGKFQTQIKEQLQPERLRSIVAYNVKTQRNPLFRALPQAIKSAAMRTAYKYFGESNSSITLTNLGSLRFPAAMDPYIRGLDVYLTPRAGSPYNCSVMACKDQLAICISRFCREPELEDVFFARLDALL